MPLFRSIQTKLILVIVGVLLITTTVVALSSLMTTSQAFEGDFARQTEKNLSGFESLLENYKTEALAHANNLATHPGIIAGTKNRDFAALLQVTAPLMQKGNLDYLVITDAKGNAIIRTHEPDKAPKGDDNIANQINVARALEGKTFTGIEQGKTVRLSVRAGAPIYDQGQLIGVLSTGYVVSRNEIVDKAKGMFGAEFSLFLGQERVATSIVDKRGQRITAGQVTADTIVKSIFNEGKPYIGENKDLDGDYITGYAPLIGADGTIIGMVGTAKEKAALTAVKQSIAGRIFLSSLVVLLLAGIIGIWFARRLARPLVELQDLMARAGAGDLTVHGAVHSTDEIGQSVAGFNLMIRRQTEIVGMVRKSAEEMAASSEEMASSAQQVMTAVQDVARNIQEVAENAERGTEAALDASEVLLELSSLIQLAKNQAAIAADNSRLTLTAAERGSETVAKSIDHMTAIKDKTNEAEAMMAELDRYSREINRMTETITAIAAQTNLLALNAAIEAARAGDAGRGFAVVADEVRKLAEESNRGAGEVAELVGKVLESAAAAVTATQQSHSEAERGAAVVQEAGEALYRILQAVQETEKAVDGIVTLTNEEVASSDRIIGLIDSIATVVEGTAELAESVAAATEETSSGMETIAAATEEASAMAIELAGAVQKFKLPDAGALGAAELLEKAKSDHLLWKIRIQNMLKGYEQVNPEEVTSHHHCRLGKWYFTDDNPFRNDPDFVALDGPHARVHEFALKAADAFGAGDREGAQRMLAELEKNSDAVLERLNRLIAKTT
ncbi:HAMP domain-containing protein [Heliobacterium gestii]|uniref:HAMP domain-containing protein n=1 Tax=Heliomicrobium gestii TaxID=2699 RepID=A0A845L7L0_HELGE|nr:methyl-accepting chemotaxis protein [Heliomicrobium gestii]MBM7866081.1 methyl-accepting chemotaxis protein [Heliomicrobium gestii]MZP42592.1 HAMP domain-containing protein [Heliomicrobium gestii]